MHITVLAADLPLSREGGGAFLSGLAGALRAAGHIVSLVATLPDAIPGALLIDGRVLPAVPPAILPRATAIVHHPAALATDPDAARTAERERFPLLHRVVATSQAVGDRLVAGFGVDPARLRVVVPGTPALPRAPGSGGPGCAILCVGALVPRKGHATLLRALARLDDLDWTLLAVGDDARDPAHAAVLRAEAGPRVRFAGSLDPAALHAAWRGADLFALATEWEGHSAAVAEALRRGLPVAVTAGGAAADGITPDTGVVCQPGDDIGLSKALRRLIYDATLRADMAEHAWQAGRALPDWDTQAALVLDMLASEGMV